MTKLTEWRDGSFRNIPVQCHGVVKQMPVKVLVTQEFYGPPPGLTLSDMIDAHALVDPSNPSVAFDWSGVSTSVWKVANFLQNRGCSISNWVGAPVVVDWMWDPALVANGTYLGLLFENVAPAGVLDIGTPLTIPKFQYASVGLRRKEPLALAEVTSGAGLASYHSYLRQYFDFKLDASDGSVERMWSLFGLQATGTPQSRIRANALHEQLSEFRLMLYSLGEKQYKAYVKEHVRRSGIEVELKNALITEKPTLS